MSIPGFDPFGRGRDVARGNPQTEWELVFGLSVERWRSLDRYLEVFGTKEASQGEGN